MQQFSLANYQSGLIDAINDDIPQYIKIKLKDEEDISFD